MKKYDYTVIGTGIAGICSAITLSEKGYSVCMLYKEDKKVTNSYRAQGGISIPVLPTDSTEKHLKDTINAGKGLNDPEMCSILINSAPEVLNWLKNRGVNFEKEPTREAAHSEKRVLHIGDITGREIQKALFEYISEKSLNIVFENKIAIDLVKKDNKISHIFCKCGKSGKISAIYSKAFIIATGGIGNIFVNTSNSSLSNGDGIAMAARAGAKLCDMEFIQFHPTVFVKDNINFLISEAVRGEGAYIIDDKGKRFLFDYTDEGELASRDIVSLSIAKHMMKNNLKNVFIDATHLKEEYLKKRFPNIFEYCMKAGINMGKEPAPVSPAAHYFLGGIYIDSNSRTDIENLYACGECAGSRVHGANRLASNSLLECIVFGIKAGNHALTHTDYIENPQDKIEFQKFYTKKKALEYILELKRYNERCIGINRKKESISRLLDYIEGFEDFLKITPKSYEENILRNMLYISKIIAECALFRKESRGVHFRTDYPEKDSNFDFHTCFLKGEITSL